MRFVVFLLSLVAALTAVGTLFLGTMAIFTDNPHDPKIAWGYALIVDAGLMIALGVVAGFLVWVTPRIAEKALWLGTLAGLAAMAIYGTIIFIARDYPNAPDVRTAITSILLSGLVPAIAAASAALLTRWFVIPKMR